MPMGKSSKKSYHWQLFWKFPILGHPKPYSYISTKCWKFNKIFSHFSRHTLYDIFKKLILKLFNFRIFRTPRTDELNNSSKWYFGTTSHTLLSLNVEIYEENLIFPGDPSHMTFRLIDRISKILIFGTPGILFFCSITKFLEEPYFFRTHGKITFSDKINFFGHPLYILTAEFRVLFSSKFSFQDIMYKF